MTWRMYEEVFRKSKEAFLGSSVSPFSPLLHSPHYSRRLKRKIATPHDSLSSSLLLLTRLRRTASLARRSQRFMVLARRLEAQMGEITSANVEASKSANGDGKAEEKRERAMAESALTLAEIGTLCSPFSLIDC